MCQHLHPTSCDCLQLGLLLQEHQEICRSLPHTTTVSAKYTYEYIQFLLFSRCVCRTFFCHIWEHRWRAFSQPCKVGKLSLHASMPFLVVFFSHNFCNPTFPLIPILSFLVYLINSSQSLHPHAKLA